MPFHTRAKAASPHSKITRSFTELNFGVRWQAKRDAALDSTIKIDYRTRLTLKNAKPFSFEIRKSDVPSQATQ
jgi:hypothetical protein